MSQNLKIDITLKTVLKIKKHSTSLTIYVNHYYCLQIELTIKKKVLMSGF